MSDRIIGTGVFEGYEYRFIATGGCSFCQVKCPGPATCCIAVGGTVGAWKRIKPSAAQQTGQPTCEPTVPGPYWVKLPLTRSFVLEISKEDIERKYILMRLGDGGKEIVHFEKIKFSGPIPPPEGWGA